MILPNLANLVNLAILVKVATTTYFQDHILTENIKFVWSKTSYSGDKTGCHQAGRTNQPNEKGKIEPLGSWKAEFRNMLENKTLFSIH